VIFGAGSVGRGFLGQLFSESGFDVVFVDVDDVLVSALAERGAYTLRLAGVTSTSDLRIGPVRAIDGRDTGSVSDAVAAASLVATAVGARALSAIAVPLAQGLAARWAAGNHSPLNVIICENLHDAPDILHRHLAQFLPADSRDRLHTHVGLVPAVIARMSPVPTEEQREADPTLIVAEPYKVLPVDRDALLGDIPEVVGMKAVSPFEAYTARKLFVHNAGHAILGYLGAARGHAFGYEALEDPWVRDRLDRGLGESGRALVETYGFEPVAFQEHIDYLLVRFANRALADPVSRLARDPLRKLAPDDRLVGAARLVEQCGIRPVALAWGIAGALAYVHPEDRHAVALQQRIAAEGVNSVLLDVCGIRSDETLGKLVLERYVELRH
jgi:mannitol-1-phosphate 5-dehydrogenase